MSEFASFLGNLKVICILVGLPFCIVGLLLMWRSNLAARQGNMDLSISRGRQARILMYVVIFLMIVVPFIYEIVLRMADKA